MASPAGAFDEADLLLLLPAIPRSVTCAHNTLADVIADRWRIEVTTSARSSTFASDDAEVASGRHHVAALERRFANTAVWTVLAVPGDATALVPRGRPDLVADLRARFGRPRRPPQLSRLARERRFRPLVVGAGWSDAPPAVVACGLTSPSSSYVVLFADPRRRAAVIDPRRGVVIKMARAAGQAERAKHELAVRERLRTAGVSHVPALVGSSVEHEPTWLAEELAAGTSLETLTARDALDMHVLDDVADWLLDVATKTRAGSPDRLRIVTHGDLAMGTNILVAGTAFTVLDWETAREGGQALEDLLPLLCLSVARAEAGTDASSQSDVALRLCRGQHPRSAWLFGHVQRHLGELTIDVEHAGALAANAWEAVASMRAARDVLVVAAAQRHVDWESPAELVARAWAADPLLGSAWRAFGSWAGSS